MAEPKEKAVSVASVRVRFQKERETKNTVRFAEVTDTPPVIGTLYVQKSALAEIGNPDFLTVTIEASE